MIPGVSARGTEQGFPRSKRLLRKSDYEAVFKQGQRLGGHGFSVILRRRDDREGARLGLAISKRSAPRAVDRNRLKRALRERFRRAWSGLRSVDLVVLCRELPKSELATRQAVDGIWQRIENRCAR